jgi:hypothetical protein
MGLSELLIRQSAGEMLHPLLAYRCHGPPFYSYHGAGWPEGPPLAPLWDVGDSVAGVWEPDGRLEFVSFSIEAPHEFRVLARTEQGLWATVFVSLYEDHDDLAADAFGDAARAVGFHYLEQTLAAYESPERASFKSRDAFLMEWVKRIDSGSIAES